MFGIGMTELVVIFVIGLLVLGPKRLPEMARSLGKSLAEFRRASTDLRREFLAVTDEPPPARPNPNPAAAAPAASPAAPPASEGTPGGG
jgi:TatA/E family protein of Tat protein translocase